jgi:Zn-dependent protease with chaperone function
MTTWLQAGIIHPADQAMRQHLEAAPALRTAVNAYLKLVQDRRTQFRLYNEGIRLGPDQLPQVYELLPPVCRAYGITEPELFLEGDESNAFATGAGQPVISIGSPLLGYLDDEELQAIIAHECGHVIAEHLLYTSMAIYLADGALTGAARLAGPFASLASLVSGPLEAALMAWRRTSELTADRAAISYLGSPAPLIRGLLKMSGMPSAAAHAVDLPRLAAQADLFDPLNRTMWHQLMNAHALRRHTHPMLAVRTREALRWAASTESQQLHTMLRRQLATTIACTGCQTPLQPAWQYCLRCGTPTAPIIPKPTTSGSHHDVPH